MHAMGVTSREKAELVSYQLKDVAQVCTQNGKAIGRLSRVLLNGKNLKKLLLERTFPMRGWILR